MSAMDAAYEPLILVDTSTLTEEQWLDYRRLGIGGSDAAAVLGISPCQECGINGICKNLAAIRFCPWADLLADAA